MLFYGGIIILIKKIINFKPILPIIVLFFLIGHFVSIFFNIHSFVILIFAVIFLGLTYFKRIFFIFSMFMLGIVNGNTFVYPLFDNNNIAFYNFDGEKIKITGIVKDCDDFERYQRGIVYITKIQKDEFVYNVDGKVIFNNYSNIKLKNGDLIEVFEKLNKPNKPENYGSFDYSFYLKQQNIFYKITIKKDLKIISKNNLSFYEKIRQNLRDFFTNKFKNTDSGGFYKALFLGNDNHLNEEFKENMFKSGLGHLIAISGFNFAILYLIFYNIFIFLFKLSSKLVKKIDIYKYSSVITLVLMFIYIFIIDFQISAVRAFIMIGFYILSKLLERKFDIIYILSLSAFVILTIYPESFVSLGFYLSFLAVLSLVMIVNYFDKKFYKYSKIKKIILLYVITNISIFIITLPILLFMFYKTTLAQLIFNSFFVPYFSFVLYPISLILLLISIFVNVDFLFDLNYTIFEKTVNFLENNWVIVHPINIFQLILMFAAIFSVFIFIKTQNKKVLLLFLLYFSVFYNISRFDGLNVYFLAVGNGDSILIETPDKKYVIVDGGPELFRQSGKNIIVPHLNYLGGKQITLGILTHFDEDHYGGILYLLKENLINKLLTNKPLEKPLDLYPSHNEIISNSTFIIDNVKFTLFSKTNFEGDNNNSIVTLIEYENYKILLTGDIEKEREEDFIKEYSEKVNILKLPHHGSKSSSTKEFLQSLNPDLSIISAGKNNKFKHPHKNTLERLKELNLKYLRTDIQNEIHINILNGKINIFTPFE